MPLPDELRSYPQWLVSAGDDKAPRSVKTGSYADVRDRNLYAGYEEAVAFASSRGWDIGFALTPQDPFTVIDLDEPATPEQVARHTRIFQAFQTYAELSRSGRGVHIWCNGTVDRGVRRDGVEVYPRDRYIICTGNVLRDSPITDQQWLLTQLYEEMGGATYQDDNPLEEVAPVLDDMSVVEMGMNAINGDKFNELCCGRWEGDYPSQSEADYALMNMFCFYTRSNEQAKRLFRMSGLGKRSKAQREPYLDRMVQKIRSEELPLVDFSELTLNGNGHHTAQIEVVWESGNVPEPLPTSEPNLPVGQIEWPPGYMGELARYIYDSSIRPVREVAIAGALAGCAGIVGRQYNISSMGLNQYFMLLGETAIGKEGANSGIERIYNAISEEVPAVHKFRGPARFASGQAIIKELNEQPCFVSVLGEIGLFLQSLNDSQYGNNVIYKAVLLDVFTQSGKGKKLHPSAHSDRGKNTLPIPSPALTILGDATPKTFYEGLDKTNIAEGLVPRFLVIEYHGDRPAPNRTAFKPPPKELISPLADLAAIICRMQDTHSWQDVELSADADVLVRRFEQYCDRQIHQRKGDDGMRQLWSRGNEKALRLAALLAVVDRPHQPVVNAEEITWAIELVRRDVENLTKHFERGDIGKGESVQAAAMMSILDDYTSKAFEAFAGYKDVKPEWHADRVISLAYIQARAYQLNVFRHKPDVTRAINDTIKHLVESEVLQELPKQQAKEKYHVRSRTLYFVSTYR